MKRSAPGTASGVHVAVRVRPMNEMERQTAGCVEAVETGETFLIVKQPDSSESTFAFDSVFGPDASTTEMWEKVAEPIVSSCMNGVNGTLFAYGQTASGKTFTMQGKESYPGILRLAARRLFEPSDKWVYSISVSYMEIYNEKIKDLLCAGTGKIASEAASDLKIREDPQKGFFVEGLVEAPVQSYEQLLERFQEGEKRRHVAGTDMNEKSSRSHTVFAMHIVAKPSMANTDAEHMGGALRSRLSLVDLAGSENVRSTHAEGERLKEGGQINKSLLTLSMVISTLAKNAGKKDAAQFIKFRDSKLTQILQPSLIGNCRTAVICCVTPASIFSSETISTLKFANSAKNIKTEFVVNQIVDATRSLKSFQEQVDALQNTLRVERMELESLRAAGGNHALELSKFKDEILRLSGELIEKEHHLNAMRGELLAKDEESEAESQRFNQEMEEKENKLQTMENLLREAEATSCSLGAVLKEEQQRSSSLSEALKEQTSKTSALAIQLSDERDKSAELSDSLRIEREKVKTQQQLSTRLEEALNEERRKLESREDELNAALTRERDLKSDLQARDSTLKQVHKEMESLRNKCVQLETKALNNQQELETTQARLDESEQELKETTEAKQELKSELKVLSGRFQVSETSKAEVEKELKQERREFHEKQSNYEKQLQSAQDELLAQQVIVGKRDEEIASLRKTIQVAQQKNQQLVKDLEDLRSKKEEEVQSMQLKISQLKEEKEIASHQARFALKTKEQELDSIRSAMSAVELEKNKKIESLETEWATTEKERNCLEMLTASMTIQLEDSKVSLQIIESAKTELETQLQAERQDSGLRSKELCKDLQKSKDKCLALESKAETLTKELDEIKKAKCELESTLESSQAQLANQQSEALVLEQQVKDQAEEISALEAVKSELLSQVEEMTSSLKVTTSDWDKTTASLEAMTRSRDELESLLKDCTLQRDALESSLKESTSVCDELQTSLTATKKELSIVTNNLQQVVEGKSRLEATLAEMESTSESLQLELDAVTEAKSLVERELVEARESELKTQTTLSKVESQLNETSKALAAKEVEILQLRDQVDSLRGDSSKHIAEWSVKVEAAEKMVLKLQKEVQIREDQLESLQQEYNYVESVLIQGERQDRARQEESLLEMQQQLTVELLAVKEEHSKVESQLMNEMEALQLTVNDLSVCLQGEGLELQSERVAYEEDRNRLHSQMEVAQVHINELHVDNEGLELELRCVLKERELLVEVMKDLQQQVNDLYLDRDGLQNELVCVNQLHLSESSRVSDVESQSLLLTTQLQSSQEALEAVQEELNSIGIDRDGMENELLVMNNRLNQVETEIETTQKELSAVTEDRDRICGELSKVQSSLGEEHRELHSIKTELVNSVKEKDQLQGMVESLQDEVNHLTLNDHGFVLELASRLQEMEELQQLLNAFALDRDGLNMELTSRLEEIGDLQQALNAFALERDGLVLELGSRLQEMEGLQQVLNDITLDRDGLNMELTSRLEEILLLQEELNHCWECIKGFELETLSLETEKQNLQSRLEETSRLLEVALTSEKHHQARMEELEGIVANIQEQVNDLSMRCTGEMYNAESIELHVKEEREKREKLEQILAELSSTRTASQTELAMKAQEVRGLQETTSSLQASLAESETLIHSMKTELKSKQAMADKTKKELTSTQKRVTSLETELKAKEEMVVGLEVQVKSQQEELALVESVVADSQQELNRLHMEMDGLEMEIHARDDVFEATLRQKDLNHTAEINQLKCDMEDQKAIVVLLEGCKTNLEAMVEQYQQEINGLRVEISGLVHEHLSYEDNVAKDVQNYLDEIALMRKSNLALETERKRMSQLQSEVATHQGDLGELQIRLNEKEQTIIQLSSQLKQMESSMNVEMERLKAVWETAKKQEMEDHEEKWQRFLDDSERLNREECDALQTQVAEALATVGELKKHIATLESAVTDVAGLRLTEETLKAKEEETTELKARLAELEVDKERLAARNEKLERNKLTKKALTEIEELKEGYRALKIENAKLQPANPESVMEYERRLAEATKSRDEAIERLKQHTLSAKEREDAVEETRKRQIRELEKENLGLYKRLKEFGALGQTRSKETSGRSGEESSSSRGGLGATSGRRGVLSNRENQM